MVKWTGNTTRALLALLLIAAVAGCGEQEDLFERGEYLMLEARWAEAIPVLRQYLLENPGHPGAHFYLGRAYMLSGERLLLHAEGELITARHLFHEQGGESPIERFSDTYFELICHLELAKVYMQIITILIEQPFNDRFTETALKRIEEQLEAAREIDPDSPDVETLDEFVKEVRETFDAMERPEPTPPRRPDPIQPPRERHPSPDRPGSPPVDESSPGAATPLTA